MKPRLLETFGCEGGASVGYARWFRVYVVDLDENRLRRNPFSKHHGDALEVLRRLIAGERLAFISPDGETEWLGLEDFAAIHASPPCQWYTRGNAQRRGEKTMWERSIPAVREVLEETGKPYVIENVKDAGWDMVDPVALCGCMFDLSVRDYTCTSPGEHPGVCDTEHGVVVHLQRPRLFETSWGLAAPRDCDHSAHEWVAGAYGGARRDKYEAKYIRKGGYVPPKKDLVKALLGIEHDMTWKGLFECIPPAYADWVGSQLVQQL